MGRRVFNVFRARGAIIRRLAMDNWIMAVYFGFLGFTVALGLAGELLHMPALCRLAVKLGIIFLSTLGVLMSVGVGLALCWCAWMAFHYVWRAIHDRMH